MEYLRLHAESKKRGVPHGKISFEDMAKEIGKRWKNISPSERERAKVIALKDLQRYRAEMSDYNQETQNLSRPFNPKETLRETYMRKRSS